MIEINTNAPGSVKIADDVLAVIAGTAAMEAEGVAGLSGTLADDITGRLGRKNLSRGVEVRTEGETVFVSIGIIAKAEAKIQEVSREVQQRIKAAVETMTGLTVSSVNVAVCAVADNKRGA